MNGGLKKRMKRRALNVVLILLVGLSMETRLVIYWEVFLIREMLLTGAAALASRSAFSCR
jgi:hypothetical protein